MGMENVQILMHDNDKIEIGSKTFFNYDTNCFKEYIYNGEKIYGQKEFYIKVAKTPLYSIDFDSYIVGNGTGKYTIKFDKTEIVFSYDTTKDSPVIKLDQNTSEYNASFEILQTFTEGITGLTSNSEQVGVKVCKISKLALYSEVF